MALTPATTETKYEPVPGWARIPHGIWLKEATSVSVDSKDNVYVFNRGNMPVLVFNQEGDVIDMWGNDDPHRGVAMVEDPYGNLQARWKGTMFQRAHGCTVDVEDNVWLTDDVGNKIYKTDGHGKILMTIGSGVPSPRQSGRMFSKPTDTAVSPVTGEIFISDGYGNSRVHRLDPDGGHIMSWGE